MAIERLRIIADEILVTIKQTFDDKQVSQAQVAYWVIAVANKLLGQHNAKRDSGAFMTTFTNIPVQVATASTNPNIVAGRKYIELPGNIFDYDKDGGVEYIAYYRDEEAGCTPDFHKKTIQRTTPGEVSWLLMNKYTEPNISNPYWYRTNDIIYLLGIENHPVKFIEMGVYLTISPLEKIDIDQPLEFPGELLETLKRQVVDLARYSYLFPQDRSNDGNDDESTKAIPKIQSVNQQDQQQ